MAKYRSKKNPLVLPTDLKTTRGSSPVNDPLSKIFADRAVTMDAFAAPPGSLDIKDKPTQVLEREREVLGKALIEEERELGKQNFWYFLTEILFPKTWREHYTEDFHGEICQAAQNLKE